MHYNMVNEAMNAKKSVINPCACMAATMFIGSDRYGMVVTKVISSKNIMVTHLRDKDIDELVTINGIEFVPEDLYEFYENGTGYYAPIEYTLRKNGRWMPKGSGMWETCSIHIGHAENYRDPSF